MVPILRRASSFLVVVFIHVNRKEEEKGETDQQQFTKGCNILHRLQVYHLTLTFIIHNKYISTLYLYKYIHIPICDRLCENQTCRGKIGTTIQAKIGGQYKFVDLLIIDSLVSLDIVLSICEVSANLTNAFTPKICSETSPLLGIPQKLNFAIVFLLTVIHNELNRNTYNILGESREIAPSSSF